jgi:excinuclease ABC subunit A
MQAPVGSEIVDQESSKPVSQLASKSAAKGKKTLSVPVADLSEGLKERLGELRRRGYNRLWQADPADDGEAVMNGAPGGGKVVEFSTPESLLELDFARPIYVLADRLALSAEVRSRLVDAIETGYREAGEIVLRTVPRDDEAAESLRFSAAFECSTCHRAYREPEPRLFSFNNPYGAFQDAG